MLLKLAIILIIDTGFPVIQVYRFNLQEYELNKI